MTIFITRDENCPYFEEFCQFVYEETGANVKIVEEGDRRAWEARPLVNELFDRWCGVSRDLSPLSPRFASDAPDNRGPGA